MIGLNQETLGRGVSSAAPLPAHRHVGNVMRTHACVERHGCRNHQDWKVEDHTKARRVDRPMKRRVPRGVLGMTGSAQMSG